MKLTTSKDKSHSQTSHDVRSLHCRQPSGQTMNLPTAMKFFTLVLYTSMLAIGEAFYQPQVMAEQSGRQGETTASSKPIELSRCGSEERYERWQRSSEY